MKTTKDDQQPPITLNVSGLDPETREAFRRQCEVEEDRLRNERQRLDMEAVEKAHAREAAEPARIVERAKAEVEAQRLAGAAMLEQARDDLEIRKLRIEGHRLEAESQLGLAAKVVELAWPRLVALGSGLAAEARQDRELIREEMRLIAGRNPVDGTKS